MNKKILIIGIDGYLGYALAQNLARDGYVVSGIDAYYRRQQVKEMNSFSAIPISSTDQRKNILESDFKFFDRWVEGDITDYKFLKGVLKDIIPDTIVHLGENPSAPFSMKNQKNSVWVHNNNVIGSLNVLWGMKEVCPEAHLIKLGTMGEYGTPNIDIAEGFFEIEFRGRKDKLPFPRQAGSWYHQTKVHDTHNTMMACKIWGIKATDIMQGVVYGTRFSKENILKPEYHTRLDFDECFGTVINRFVCQAVIDHPLTIYGSGKQTRSFIPLIDSMQCMRIAIDNPPSKHEYRTLNQFENTYSVNELASVVKKNAEKNFNLNCSINYIKNPRLEPEDHYYNPDRVNLTNLGYLPTTDIDETVRNMLEDLIPHKNRIKSKKDILVPKITWD